MGITKGANPGARGSTGPTGLGVTGPTGVAGPVGATGETGPGLAYHAWNNLPFNPFWTNYGGGWQICQYRLGIYDNIVHVRGLATVSGSAVNAIWSALAVQYRPPANVMFELLGSSANANRFDVYPDGTCTYFGALNGAWVSLSGISWSVT